MVTQAAEMAKLQCMVTAMVAGTAGTPLPSSGGGGGSGLNLGATGHLRKLASPGVVPTATPSLSLGDKDAGWGASFTLPKADRHLPFYFDEAALHRIYPLISNGDPVSIAPVPTPTPTPNPVDVLNATLVARLAVQEAQMVTQAAEMAKLQSMVAAMVAGTPGGGGSGLNLGATGHLRNLASPGVVPTVTPSGVVPTDHTLAFIQMMSQMNSTMALALAGKAQAAPVIIVPPAQSETRRQDLNSIQAIKPIFDEAHFEAAWQPMDFAAGGEPASYNMDHARAAMRAALNKRLNQRGREYTKDFLRGTALFHWDMGAEGVTLEQFLPTKGKIVTWADFTAAWITMQRAYEDFAGPTLAMALVRFQSDLVELNATLRVEALLAAQSAKRSSRMRRERRRSRRHPSLQSLQNPHLRGRSHVSSGSRALLPVTASPARSK